MTITPWNEDVRLCMMIINRNQYIKCTFDCLYWHWYLRMYSIGKNCYPFLCTLRAVIDFLSSSFGCFAYLQLIFYYINIIIPIICNSESWFFINVLRSEAIELWRAIIVLPIWAVAIVNVLLRRWLIGAIFIDHMKVKIELAIVDRFGGKDAVEKFPLV